MKSTRVLLSLVAILFIAGLGTGCKTTYYSVWEKLGKHKRDLLRDQVEEVRDEQTAAKEEFKDALTRLKELTGFEGGKLEEAYRGVEKDYRNLNSRGDSIRSRIRKIEDVAADLFSEWEKELNSYESENLRASSQQKLRETKRRYESLQAALQRSADSMTPVLARLKDQSLFLKHNLNAQAIGALKGEVVSIEGDVQRLIAEMNAAIAQADQFIQNME
jgi:gas vesicle protein